MTEISGPQQYWEKKILPWEEARYSEAGGLSPLSWSVRSRLHKAVETLLARTDSSTRVLELACGSGWLAEKLHGHVGAYHGIDIAQVAIARAKARVPAFHFTAGDVLAEEFPSADLTVFLGLTDWLDERGMELLFAKLKSPRILFSYTHASPWNPYRLYRLYVDQPYRAGTQRARTYTGRRIRELLTKHGFHMEHVTYPYLLNPGALVWAQRQS